MRVWTGPKWAPPPSLHLGSLTSSGQWAVGVSSMFARLGAETVRQDVPLLADVH